MNHTHIHLDLDNTFFVPPYESLFVQFQFSIMYFHRSLHLQQTETTQLWYITVYQRLEVHLSRALPTIYARWTTFTYFVSTSLRSITFCPFPIRYWQHSHNGKWAHPAKKFLTESGARSHISSYYLSADAVYKQHHELAHEETGILPWSPSIFRIFKACIWNIFVTTHPQSVRGR